MKNAIIINLIIILTVALPAGAATLQVPAEHPTIQSAIDAAVDGDTVIVAPGTYTGEGNRYIDFKGKAITVRSENGPENCIIDCNGYRGFVFENGEDANSILIGFTIVNSIAGITCFNSSPAINNCVVSRNVMYSYGAIYCKNSSPTITNCTFNSNHSSGMYNEDSTPTLIGCTFAGNSPSLMPPWGGGMNNKNSSPEIINCTFINNSATSGGAIYCEQNSRPVLTGCTFIANKASCNGGALFFSGGEAFITNCTFVGNTAREGAGLCCYGNSVILNCTFVENTAWDFGGAIHSSGDAELVNCILYGNTAPRGAEVAIQYSPTIDINHSNIQGGSTGIYFDSHGTLNWGQDNIDNDPLFAFSTDYHLMPDSPCIDAGTNEPNSALPETDIDGGLRLLDGDGDGTAIIDMGTHEYNPQGPAIAVSASIVDFVYVPGWSEPSSKTQILQIRNCSNGLLKWKITEDCGWLDVKPSKGISKGEIDDVILTVDTSQLTTGNYDCELTIFAADAVNSPQKVIVTLCIGRILHVPSEYEWIDEAMSAAVDGDVIIVQPGSYKGVCFYGKNITLTSTNPADPNIVAETIIENVDFYGTENPSCILTGFKIKGRISGGRTRATISHCILQGNFAPGGMVIRDCDGIISNCLIADSSPYMYPSKPVIISGCHGLIKNCTIVNNYSLRSRIEVLGYRVTTIENCIIYSNRIVLRDEATLRISYSNVQGGLEGIDLEDPCTCTVNWGPGNIDTDPCFVRVGYYDEQAGQHVQGDYHLLEDSPCINAGNPDYEAEHSEFDLDGNPRIIAGKIDMGAYETPIETKAQLWIMPRTINRKSHRRNIMVWMRLPAGISRDDIDDSFPLTLYPGQIKASRQFIFENKRRHETNTSIFAFFDKRDLMTAVPDNGQVQLDAVGRLNTGRYFFGKRTIRIINRPQRH